VSFGAKGWGGELFLPWGSEGNWVVRMEWTVP